MQHIARQRLAQATNKADEGHAVWMAVAGDALQELGGIVEEFFEEEHVDS